VNRLEYLQDQLSRARTPIARKLLSDAIAEERENLAAQAAERLEATKQQANTDLSAAYSDAYAAERDAFQQGRVSELFKIEHPDLVIDEESVTDSAEDIEKQFHTAKKKFFAWLENKGIGHKQAAEIHGRWLRINTDVDLRTIAGWAASFTFCLQCSIIPPTMIEMEPQEPQAPEPVDIESIDDRTQEGRRQLHEAHMQGIKAESQPVVNKFLNDLRQAGHHLSAEEYERLANWVSERGLWPNLRQSWEKALWALFPQYLSAEDRELRDLDRNDNITSEMIKKQYGFTGYRAGFADLDDRANRK
jgi:hypothetical protein